jgi:eukaryotic-like serine/threonine-protein kinase
MSVIDEKNLSSAPDSGAVPDAIADEVSVTGPTHVVLPINRAVEMRLPGEHLDGELAPGELAGEYVIRQKIGWGGCSTVYAAEHRTSGESVAVKVMHAGLADSPRQVQRFAQEAQAVRLIQHPTIVEVHDIGRLRDGRPFIVMELLRGVNLASLLRTQGRFSPREAQELLEPLGEALTMAHEAGIVHRDIKASNVIITSDESATSRVKLLDFGIAKLTDSLGGGTMQTTVGHVLGTPHSMAPEQIRGLPVDGRTDIYALGALLFRLLTGKHPFEGCDAIALTRMHIETPPPAPSQLAPVSPTVDAVVRKAMEKDPDRRYQTVPELIQALREAVGTSGASVEENARALAVYVEARVPEGEEPDDAVVDDLMGVLDIAEQAFVAHDFAVPLITGNAILGVVLVRDDDLEAWRRRAMDLAADMEREIALRADADERVRINVCLHLDDAVVRPGQGEREIVGGPVLDVGSWAPKHDMDGVCATSEGLGFTRSDRQGARSYVRIGNSHMAPSSE